MGIYPDSKMIPTSTGYIEERSTPGVVLRRELTAGPWTEKRTDCFCCSCEDDLSVSDPFCRNHGWAASRPCDNHGMPGQPDEDNVMPISVQARRARYASQV